MVYYNNLHLLYGLHMWESTVNLKSRSVYNLRFYLYDLIVVFKIFIL